MTCTFFGHRDCYENIENKLTKTIIDLIKNKNVKNFYVGNQGKFDAIVKRKLKELQQIYPEIDYCVVLAYMPSEKIDAPTVYPSGMESVPKKYAILKRNLWMIEKSDYIVTYVNKIVGSSAHFKDVAEAKGKIVINLCL